MRRVFLVSLAAVPVLAACAPAEEEPYDPGLRVDVQELNINFAFHEPLTLRASRDEALLSGETTRMQVQTLPYAALAPAANPNQLAKWALPPAIATAVREERSCLPLESGDVYLPVDTQRPLRCDLIIDPSGRPVVWMVGIGRPFEDVPFLQSSFLVLEEGRFTVYSYVYPFPESDATVQWLTDTFAQRNPGMSTLRWPNKSFLLLIDEVNAVLGKQVEPPSPEVQDVMAALRELAFSAGPSRAMPDR